MADRPLEIVTEFPTPPYSATDPPPPSRSQLHSLFIRRKELTEDEKSAIYCKPFFCAMITFLAANTILIFVPQLPCNVNFSVESISISPSSSATLHVDFLVKNTESRCPIYYDRDDVYTKLGSLNAAVLKTSHTRDSRGRLKSFSVDIAMERNHQSHDPRVFELDMKLRSKKKHPTFGDEYGHFDIRCQNLTLGYQKIKCHSFFVTLKDSCYDLIN